MKILPTLSLVAAAALVGAALAQAPRPGDPPPDPDAPGPTDERPEDAPGPYFPAPPQSEGSPTVEPEPPDEESSAGEDTQAPATARAEKNRSSGILGRNVVTPTGETIGRVKDIVLDRSGRASHVVVAYGGPAEGGPRLAAIPWDAVQRMTRAHGIVIERARLANAPSFAANAPPDFSRPGWSREADRYWESTRAAAGESPDGSAREPASPDRG